MAQDSKTMANLQEAFAGESQANRKYLAFAKQADAEGFTQAAKLFRAAAEAETVHAHAHLKVMGGINSTKENLREAIDGETHEFKSMYPQMIAEAEKEENAQAVRTFKFANEVEKVHAGLYTKALEALGQEGSVFDYFVCSICGHTVEKAAPEKCMVCGAGSKAFFQVS
ncbi:MAG: rubrerythrin family protein [Deltaproteobacteria bacterium]|nr:rubrerythrin family protein [Deltaproteobacteria bacterium]